VIVVVGVLLGKVRTLQPEPPRPLSTTPPTPVAHAVPD